VSFVMTCVARPTSDVTIETGAEDKLYRLLSITASLHKPEERFL